MCRTISSKFCLSIFIVVLLTLFFGCQPGSQVSPTSGHTLWAAGFGYDDNYLAVGGDDGKLIIYETKKYTPFKIYTWDSATITNLQWHPTRLLLAVTGYTYSSRPDHELDHLLNVETDERYELDSLGSRGLDWNHSGSALVLADLSGGVHIYSMDGRLINSFPSGNPRSLTGISWHPSDSLLTVIGDDIRIMDIHGKLIKEIQHSLVSKLLLSVDWHPSGRFFATADYGHENEPTYVKYWSVDGQLLKTIPGSKKEIRNIQWDRDGNYLVTASEALRFIDTEGVIQFSYPYEENLLWGLDFNRDQTKLVVSGTNNLIQVVDIKGNRIKIVLR